VAEKDAEEVVVEQEAAAAGVVVVVVAVVVVLAVVVVTGSSLLSKVVRTSAERPDRPKRASQFIMLYQFMDPPEKFAQFRGPTPDLNAPKHFGHDKSENVPTFITTAIWGVYLISPILGCQPISLPRRDL
jgi:hypothetical protein